MKLFFRLLARLPLPANHAVGAFLGLLAYLFSPRYRHRLLDNLRGAGIAADAAAVKRLARRNAQEIGKGATETAWTLFRPDEVAAFFHGTEGWEAVERLRAAGRPIVFVTPHLGAYDFAGRYLSLRGLPIIAMYRPHKIGWIDDLLREGRNRGGNVNGANVAPATLGGVRMVLRQLKQGKCTVILPDQVPGEGDGEWAEFFGRPAYTMTLVARLQKASGAALVFCYAERRPGGAGYDLRLEPMDDALPDDRAAAAREVNARVERLVRRCPEQYLWGYNRYKRPAGAPPAPGGPAAAGTQAA